MLRDQTPDLPEEIVWQFLQKAFFSDEQVTTRLKQAWSLDYWRSLNPQLSVNSTIQPNTLQSITLSPDQDHKLRDRFSKQGYFQSEPILSTMILEQMRRGVENLRKNGWPPVFSFIYDQFWSIWKIQFLVDFLTDRLGVGYRQSSHVWSHYIAASDDASGWPPHVDGYRETDQITIWIPLTDATLNNGCIYLIPKHCMADEVAQRVFEIGQLCTPDLGTLLHGSRALPAQVGEILAWEYGVMHWGSICDQPKHSRISIAVNFMTERIAQLKPDKPSLDGVAEIPNFHQRLSMIAKSLITYVGREPLMNRYLNLAEKLLADIGQFIIVDA